MTTLDPTPLDLLKTWASPPPPPEFVLPGLALRTVGNVVATGSTGKTFLMLATALSVGIGRDIGDLWGEPPEAGTVVFLSLEDPRDELERRVRVVLELLSDDERKAAAERVNILAAFGMGLALGELRDKQGFKETDWFNGFSNSMRALQPRLLVIDTLNRFLGGIPENDGSLMGRVLGHIEALARDSNCAVVLCHHVNKAALGAQRANEAHAARGSSVISDNARWQVNLTVPPPPKAKKGVSAGNDEEERKRHVELEFSKLNYVRPIASRMLYRGRGGVLSLKPPPPGGSAPPPTSNGLARNAGQNQMGTTPARQAVRLTGLPSGN